MVSITELEKKYCTGCKTCEKVCPTNAIEFIENKDGFQEPIVNKEKCINCGICSKKCPQLNEVKNIYLNDVEVYAAKNKDIAIQKNSTSGGVFSAFALYVLKNKGAVYGCAFNDKLVAQHIRVDNINELYKLRGSKYVQSDTMNTFVEVKNDLLKNIIVLYVGTPCQIAALKSYLGKDFDNLLTIDLVCHGVPSPKLFSKYKEYLEKTNKAQILEYYFRNKERNIWGGIKAVFNNNKTIYRNSRLDSYNNSFYKGMISREVCYNCKYSNSKRIGDITLADFWGIEKEHSEFYDEFGVSALIVNTQMGKRFFENIKNDLNIIKSDFSKVANKNRNLISPTERPSARNDIYCKIDAISYNKFQKDELRFRKNVKEILKNLIPYKIKRIIKNNRIKRK